MEEKKNPLSATIGLLLSVIVAMGLGWFAHSIYASSQAKKAQAKAVEEAAAAAAVKPVTVETAQVTLKAINPPQSFMGHVEPIQDVDLRAQIDGTIDAVAFQEGAMVKEGDLLYRIDPRVYEARVAQAKAALAEAEARSENANRYYERISTPSPRRRSTRPTPTNSRPRPPSNSARPTSRAPRSTWATARSARPSPAASARAC